MKYHNEEMKPWMALDDKTKNHIRNSPNIECLGHTGNWHPYAGDSIHLGRIYRAPIVVKQHLGIKDIKQGDIIRKKLSEFWAYIVPHENCLGVIAIGSKSEYISFGELHKNYMIRSIGESEWRGCEK